MYSGITTNNLVELQSPLALLHRRFRYAFLAFNFVFGELSFAQLPQLICAERFSGQTFTSAFAARERACPGSADRVHVCVIAARELHSGTM